MYTYVLHVYIHIHTHTHRYRSKDWTKQIRLICRHCLPSGEGGREGGRGGARILMQIYN